MIKGQIIIKAKSGASRRTKNRIKEHGPVFLVVRESSIPQLGSAFLLMARTMNATDGRGGKEHWFGWLPIDELEIADADR